MSEVLKTGTTTLGLVCKDVIVLATDKRATAGDMIVQKRAQKLHKLAANIAVTIAGSVSDVQVLIKMIRAELKLKEVRISRRATVKEAANLLSNYVYSNIRSFSVIPGVTHFLLAGFDESGLHMYDIFPDGSVTEIDDYVSSGSGSVFVYGVLESNYKKGMDEKEAIDLATRSVNASLQRDTGSGNGLEIWAVDKNGIRVVTEKLVAEKLV
ncbi:MAG TPA: proteasome subunit beta [Candidatus Nanoarchaeia archaeon]|nr:proteasome subunit beta [Candidatus Nanoarchaeia archaeon]